MALSVEYDSRVAVCLQSDNDISRGGDYTTSLSDHTLYLPRVQVAGQRSTNSGIYTRGESTVRFSTLQRTVQDAEDALQDSSFGHSCALESFEGRSTLFLGDAHSD